MKKRIIASILVACAAPLIIFRDALGIHFCQDELNQCLMLAPFVAGGAAAVKYKGQQICNWFRRPSHAHNRPSQATCCHDHEVERKSAGSATRG